MGKPSLARDVTGAVLLVLVGMLYMSGITTGTIDRGVDSGADTANEVVEVSQPVTIETLPAWIS